MSQFQDPTQSIWNDLPRAKATDLGLVKSQTQTQQDAQGKNLLETTTHKCQCHIQTESTHGRVQGETEQRDRGTTSRQTVYQQQKRKKNEFPHTKMSSSKYHSAMYSKR